MGAVYLSASLDRPLVTCPLKVIAGVPCPACGATRGSLEMLSGDPLAAFARNPLVFAVLLLGGLALLLRVVLGKTLVLVTKGGERPFLWILAAIAVLANWAYVTLRGG
jgi:hypothetical protein